MKRGPGGRPFEAKFAFLLAVTLLLPGVTSRTLVSTTTTPPDVTSGPTAGDLEPQPEPSFEEDVTELDGTLQDDEIEAVAESPEDNNGTETNDEDAEDGTLAFLRLMVKRAAEEDDREDGKLETESVDEDKFSLSDLSRLFKPVIDAFSDSSSSEAPPKYDFWSLFPGLKDLFKPNEPRGTEATSRRRSSFPTTPPPCPQGSPVSTARPPKMKIFPSSQPDNLIATDPTIIRPPITIATPRVPISKGPVTASPSNN